MARPRRRVSNFVDYPIYLLTGEPCDDKNKFLERLESSLKSGIKLVQVRAKSLNYDQYQKIASAAVELCHQYGAKVLVSVHLPLVRKLAADGLHLPSVELMKLTNRPLGKEYLLSVACHDALQVIHAAKIDADFAVISPIFSTPSSPLGVPLGWENFSSLAKLAKIPVYALGGLAPNHLKIAKSYGAVGMAAIRSVWGR